MDKKEIEAQKYIEIIYNVAEQCKKDKKNWMLVSDFASISQKQSRIDFAYFGGPNKFLRNFKNIEVKEQKNISTGGSTSFFRIKGNKWKRKSKIIVILIIFFILILLMSVLLYFFIEEKLITFISFPISLIGSIASIYQLFGNNVKNNKEKL